MVGFIDPNGILINGDKIGEFTHRDLEKKLGLNINRRYLASVYEYKYIRINDGARKNFNFEVLAELPNVITTAQLITLAEWLDELSCRKEFVNIEIEADNVNHKVYHDESNCGFYKQYFFKETSVDEIIKDVKRYYNENKM